MIEFIETLINSENMVWWIGTFSILSFFFSISAVPVFIIGLPHDYFVNNKYRSLPWNGLHPVFRAALITGKNIAGVMILVIGFVLLFLPGQGILTMLAGIMLLDFPGKDRLMYFFVTQPAVIKSITWVRRQAGKETIIVDRLKLET